VLASTGIGGCEAHLLLSADQGLPPEIFFDNRGWSSAQQTDAARRIGDRGLLDATGITPDGRSVRSDIESTTDLLASAPFDDVLDTQGRDELIEVLTAVAKAVVASGTLPFPNPMGLPRIEVS
jgi:hypothetical protein